MNRLAPLLLLLVCAPLYSEPGLTRVGHARNPDNEQLLYTEQHCETLRDGRVIESRVIYRDGDGSKIAEKTVDFSRDPFLPEFSLVNTRTGHEETTRYEDGRYHVRFTRTAEGKISSKPVDISAGAIGDAGFDNFIITHWQDIVRGKRFSKDFLIPSMQKFFSFRIYQKGIIEKEDQRFRELYIEPDNFLLRALGKPTRLVYDYDEPVLRVFRGVSNMRDADGNNFNVVIHYRQVEPGMNLVQPTGSKTGNDCCLQISGQCPALRISPVDPGSA